MFPVSRPVLVATMAFLVGCSGGGPTFKEVTKVSVRHIASRGLTERDFSARELDSVSKCLYKTETIDASEAEQALLPTTYLIEVTDKGGMRSFELYTKTNLKGNKGQYYQNSCIHGLITAKRKAPTVRVGG